MRDPYLILYEISLYLQLIVCIPHAWKHIRANLLRLLAGTFFGVLLELATLRQLNAYAYGQFVVMVLDVPLGIGVAWGCILYSMMEFSDGTNLPYSLRPVLDALLALNIDLSLDAIAIRFGFWDWGQGPNFQYFGVPYANFRAWFWVIFFFSFGYRLFARRSDWIGAWISPLTAPAVGLLGILGTNTLITYQIPFAYHGLTVALLRVSALGIVLAGRPTFYVRSVPSLTFWVPLTTHIYVLIAGLIAGHILNPPFLLVVGVAMIAIAFLVHGRTLKHILISLGLPKHLSAA